MDISLAGVPPIQSTYLPSSTRNLIDESLVAVDALADFYGDGPVQSSETSTILQTDTVISKYSWSPAINLGLLYQGKLSDLQEPFSLN